MKIARNPFLRCGLTAALVLPMAITASADITLAPGHNTIDTTGDPALGVISRSTGDTAWFNDGGTATAAGTPVANGILGPWATIGTGTSTSYATLDGSDNVVSYTGYSDVAFNGIPNGGDGTVNYRVTSAGSVAYGSGTRNVNTLTSATGTTALTWGNSTGQINLVTNGVLNAGTGTLTLTHGGTHASSGVMVGGNNNRELVVNAANASIVLGRIVDNTDGASSVTVQASGSNTVTFTTTNTFTGGLRVNSGTLALSGNQTISQTVSGSGSISNNSGTATLSGNFSGFTGTYTHNSSTSSTLLNSTSAASKDASYHIATNQGSGQGILFNVTSGNNTFEMGSLSGVANSLVRNAAAVTGTNTLKVGNLNTDTEFAGIIGGGGGSVALEKVGDGSLTLSGASTYTGATTVSAGTLLISGALGDTAVSVASGATIGAGDLDGGSLGGNLFLASGSLLDVSNGLLNVASGKTVSFGNFDFTNLVGFDVYSAAIGTYTMIDGEFTLDSTNLAYFGESNALDLENGNKAWFSEGSLIVNIAAIPEPSAALLGGLGFLALLRRRR